MLAVMCRCCLTVLLVLSCASEPHEAPPADTQALDSTPTADSSPGCVQDITAATAPTRGGDWIGEGCQGQPPTNCIDGDYLRFDGRCYCAARCDTLGVTLGQPCDSDATFICRLLPGPDTVPRCISFEWKVCEV